VVIGEFVGHLLKWDDYGIPLHTTAGLQ